MLKTLQIFMEYKVKKDKINEYERVMEEIIDALREYGAINVQWFVAYDQPHLYVEMFQLPTHEDYIKLKAMRKSRDHPIFGKLAELVEGHEEKIHCWAFQEK